MPSEPSVEHEAWYIDSAHTAVAAVWSGGVLWVGGESVHVINSGSARALPPITEAPPGAPASAPAVWTKLAPQLGARYVAVAGAARRPDAAIGDADALIDALLDVPPAPEPSLFARLVGKRTPPVEGAVLVLDAVAATPARDLPGWLAALRSRAVDISWTANEGGVGLMHTIRRPMSEGSVRDALLDHAREHAEIAQLVAEHAEVWIEDIGEEVVDANRLVADDPVRGWVEDLELDAVATDTFGTATTWLDPGTSHARPGRSYVLPGSAILAAVRAHVEQPAIVAVHSAPVDSVLAVHLIGGIDPASGDLVGFALQRVWT